MIPSPARAWLLSLAGVVFTALLSPAATLQAAPPTEYIEGDVIVTFKSGADASTATTALTRHGMKFQHRFATLSQRRGRQTGLVRDASRKTADLITELKADATVETAEPNYLRWVTATPNDTRFSELWALQNTGQTANGTAGTAGADVQFLPAWAMAQSSSGQVVVGVIDTGVDYVHPDLAGNMWTNPWETAGNRTDDDGNGYTDDVFGYDFVDGDSNPADSGEHGTHVAGTIAAQGYNGFGVIGVNPRAKIMALKVSTNGSTISSSAAIAAIQYATLMKGRGVNIVALNASYGGGGNSSAESAAIKAAGDAGIIFCAAAGNDGANNDSTATYPASYRLANMVVVAATDQNDALASFSNYGATKVDLAAPGKNILSTKPSTVSFKAGATTYSSTVLTYSGATTGLTGSIVYCGIGNPAEFPTSVRGNIALIARGTLTFAEKVTNAMAAGATAAIIYNNVTGSFSGTLSTEGNWIPARSISLADGIAIRNALPLTGSIVVTGNYQYLDGTSMATPHVTAAISFAAANFPGESVAQRLQRLLTHVDVKPSLTGKVATGGRLNLLRMVDGDANSLPDWWEQTYFSQSGGVSTETDSDGDGMTNLQEFLAGTSPVDGQSSLHVSAAAFSPAGSSGSGSASTTSTPGLTLSWPAVPGKTYQVLTSETLTGTWSATLPNSLLTAQPEQTSLTYTDTTVTGSIRRFYKIQVVP